MAGLQRSEATFRRSGSSGMVWEEKFSSELIQQMEKNASKDAEGVEFRELRPSRSVGSTGMLQHSADPPEMVLKRSRSKGKHGGGGGGGGGGVGSVVAAPKQAAKEVSPAVDPPSPKLSACGFCSIFGTSKPVPAARKQRKKGKR